MPGRLGGIRRLRGKSQRGSLSIGRDKREYNLTTGSAQGEKTYNTKAWRQLYPSTVIIIIYPFPSFTYSSLISDPFNAAKRTTALDPLRSPCPAPLATTALITHHRRMLMWQPNPHQQQLRNHHHSDRNRKNGRRIHTHSVGIDHRKHQRPHKARRRGAHDGQRAEELARLP